MEIKKAVTVLKSPEELYRYWRKFDLLPNFMENIEAVTPLGAGSPGVQMGCEDYRRSDQRANRVEIAGKIWRRASRRT